MMIEKLNVTNPIANIQNVAKMRDLSELKTTDSVTLSSDATKLADYHLAMQAIKVASDVRFDKIAEVKGKLSDPSYMDNGIDKVADILVEMYKA